MKPCLVFLANISFCVRNPLVCVIQRRFFANSSVLSCVLYIFSAIIPFFTTRFPHLRLHVFFKTRNQSSYFRAISIFSRPNVDYYCRFLFFALHYGNCRRNFTMQKLCFFRLRSILFHNNGGEVFSSPLSRIFHEIILSCEGQSSVQSSETRKPGFENMRGYQ